MTNTDCGALKNGTEINANSEVIDILHDMVYQPEPPAPSTEYESISIGTWSSASDVDTFFNAHTAWNGWAGLKLGNYVTINDGTYNTQWEIAGFNMEHNQTAADETVYDNGVGICMIPKRQVANAMWHSDRYAATPYINSDIHKTTLVTVANKLKGIIGDHLVQRNVLLGSAQNGTSPRNFTTSAYQWTTSYCTLMSIGQMTGNFAANNNKYDDGEANYKLPVFDHENYYIGSGFWSRNVWGYNHNYGYHIAWGVHGDGYFVDWYVHNTIGVRPLIYLR